MVKVVHTFLKDISPKVNVIAWMVFELAYNDSAVQHLSLYAMGTSLIVVDNLKA